MEGVIDRCMCGEESLRRSGGLEALHPSFMLPYREMRILGPIVDPSAGDVASLHAKITQCRAMRWQFVGHGYGWSKVLYLGKLLHRFHCDLPIPAESHENVRVLAFRINGAPTTNAYAIDPDETSPRCQRK